MSLNKPTIDLVMGYCQRDLPVDRKWYEDQFYFIKTTTLRKELGKAFYGARYIYKLMEALHVTGDELQAHAKFQVMQYASIYEACINYILLTYYKTHPEVIKIATHHSLKEVSGTSKNLKLEYDGSPAIICVRKITKTDWTAISFEHKVDCAVSIGFISARYADELKNFYRLRNGIHIESAAKRQLEYQLEQAKLAYRRINPFLAEIRKHFAKMAASTAKGDPASAGEATA